MKEILCANNSIGSWFLRFCMASKWSHAAVLDGDMVTHTTLWGGGVKAMSAVVFFEHYPRYQLKDMALHDESGARAWLREQEGKSYDFTALFWFVLQFFFQRDWQDPKNWFCSELVETVRSKFGTSRFREDLSHISPRHMDMVL